MGPVVGRIGILELARMSDMRKFRAYMEIDGLVVYRDFFGSPYVGPAEFAYLAEWAWGRIRRNLEWRGDDNFAVSSAPIEQTQPERTGPVRGEGSPGAGESTLTYTDLYRRPRRLIPVDPGSNPGMYSYVVDEAWRTDDIGPVPETAGLVSGSAPSAQPDGGDNLAQGEAGHMNQPTGPPTYVGQL